MTNNDNKDDIMDGRAGMGRRRMPLRRNGAGTVSRQREKGVEPFSAPVVPTPGLLRFSVRP